MAAPAAPPTPRAPPAAPAPAAPPGGLVVARWLYVDEHRTHEVHAGVRPGPKPVFVVKESAYHNEAADEVVLEERAIEAPWEAQLYHWALECRLALLGKYWRHDAAQPGWRALNPPQGMPTVDLREAAVSPYRGRVAFHHFHHRRTREDRLLVAIPDATAGARRTLLVRAALVLPDADDADLRLLHAHLPDGPARSLLAREHLALRQEGFEKLVDAQDFARAHGASWPQHASQVYADVLRRVSEGGFGQPSRPRSAPIDPVYTDFVAALTDPRLLQLQARFLTPEEQDAALREGGAAIRRLIAGKRQGAPPQDQHKLTLVEASLLAREQLRPGQRARVDPEVASLVRRFAFYL